MTDEAWQQYLLVLSPGRLQIGEVARSHPGWTASDLHNKWQASIARPVRFATQTPYSTNLTAYRRVAMAQTIGLTTTIRRVPSGGRNLPSLSAAPRMRHRAFASLSAFASDSIALPPTFWLSFGLSTMATTSLGDVVPQQPIPSTDVRDRMSTFQQEGRSGAKDRGTQRFDAIQSHIRSPEDVCHRIFQSPKRQAGTKTSKACDPGNVRTHVSSRNSS